jgi:RimJ/RimL family protein N-acetyltransferase
MDVPVVTTPRLVLRGITAADAEPYARMMADPEVARHHGDGRPLSRPDAWRQLAFHIGHWALRGFGFWAVEERETGRFIGRIGCFEPEGWPGFEVGYSLARESWGKGYAREGAAAALHHARTVLGKRVVISVIRPANAASIRVATALGARKTATLEVMGAESDIYTYPDEG